MAFRRRGAEQCKKHSEQQIPEYSPQKPQLDEGDAYKENHDFMEDSTYGDCSSQDDLNHLKAHQYMIHLTLIKIKIKIETKTKFKHKPTGFKQDGVQAQT